MGVEFLRRILQVKLHRAFAQENFVSDLLIAEALGNKANYINFSIS
jgi:hypothetical protein